jgi:hypothetical protein
MARPKTTDLIRTRTVNLVRDLLIVEDMPDAQYKAFVAPRLASLIDALCALSPVLASDVMRFLREKVIAARQQPEAGNAPEPPAPEPPAPEPPASEPAASEPAASEPADAPKKPRSPRSK